MSTKLAKIDNGKTSEEGDSRLYSKLFGMSGVISAGDLLVTANGTPDNTVKIALGDVIIGNAAPSASNYYYHGWVTVQDSVTITANVSGNPRIDCIVAYVDKSAVSSATSDNPSVLKFKDVTGTPAGSPVAPNTAAIQTSVGASNPFVVLANVNVANGFATIVTGNITDTRVFVTNDKVRATNSGNQTLSTGIGTVLTWDTETFDTNNIHSTVTNNSRHTAQRAGYYRIEGLARWGTESATGVTEVFVKLNGATTIYGYDMPANLGNIGQPVSFIYYLNLNDYVEMIGQQSSGGNKTVTSLYSFFSIELIP